MRSAPLCYDHPASTPAGNPSPPPTFQAHSAAFPSALLQRAPDDWPEAASLDFNPTTDDLLSFGSGQLLAPAGSQPCLALELALAPAQLPLAQGQQGPLCPLPSGRLPTVWQRACGRVVAFCRMTSLLPAQRRQRAGPLGLAPPMVLVAGGSQ